MSTYTPAKRKTIEQVIAKKVEDWLASLPSELQMQARKNVIVTGGSIVSLYTGEPINDFDIYFKDKETTIAVAQHYAKKSPVPVEVKVQDETNIKGEVESRVINYIASAGVYGSEQLPDEYTDAIQQSAVIEEQPVDKEAVEEERYRIQFISRNAITLSDKMQIITRFYGDPEKIHQSFDFVHCMGYYDHGTGTVNVTVEALEAMMSKTLVYKGSLYPIASIFRMKKFVERGWRIGAGEMLKMMWQISELDLTDTHLLIDQLTGADMVYMLSLIQALESAPEGTLINSQYVTEIIDRIFK